MIAPGSPKKMGIEMVKSCAPARFTIKDKKRVPAQFDESWDSMGFPRNDVNVGPKDLRCSLAAPGLHRYTVLVAPGVVRKCNGYSKTLYVTLCDYGT